MTFRAVRGDRRGTFLRGTGDSGAFCLPPTWARPEEIKMCCATGSAVGGAETGDGDGDSLSTGDPPGQAALILILVRLDP
jgi:hypothetical protein